jgi:hypothetical protein
MEDPHLQQQSFTMDPCVSKRGSMPSSQTRISYEIILHYYGQTKQQSKNLMTVFLAKAATIY